LFLLSSVRVQIFILWRVWIVLKQF
jgi:hypothetical protein